MSKRVGIISIAAVLAIVIGIFFGLSLKNKEPEPVKPPVEQKPVSGGTLSIGTYRPNVQIDPLKYNGNIEPIFNINSILYKGLFTYDKDLALQPELATSYSIVNNTIEITLKGQAKFEDGTEITPEDVKETIEFYGRPDYFGDWKTYTFDIKGSEDFRKNYYKGTDPGISGITINNEKNNVTIEYDSRDAKDLQILVAPILSEKQLAGKRSDEVKEISLKGKLMATGPYKMAGSPGGEIRLSRNENYDQQPYIDTITFKGYSLENNLMIGMPQNIETNKDKKVLTFEGEGYTYLGMNLNQKDLKNQKIREALTLGLNNQEIIQKIYQGYADKPATIIPKPWTKGEINISSNIEEAKSLLSGKQLSFQLAYADTPLNKMLATEIANQYATLGITIKLQPVDQKTYLPELFSKGEYDLFLASWPYTVDPVFENYKWLSKNDVMLGGYNVSHVNDETSDKLLTNGEKVTDQTKRIGVYSEWVDYFMHQYYIIPIASPQIIFLNDPNVNIEMTNSLIPYADIENWWIKPENQ